ncbi:MAG: PilN domain-containing protein [Xanthobacteraceae bacterium]
MRAVETLTSGVSAWLDQAAAGTIAAAGRFTAPRTLRLREGEDGQFAVLADAGELGSLEMVEGRIADGVPAAVSSALRGSHIELELGSEHFLIKPLELPARAAEFLDGIVRSQIDRLTPWSAAHAAFGTTAPAAAGAGRIMVTVAATARAVLAPFIAALATAGVRSIAISARWPEGKPIVVWRENLTGIDVAQVRRVLLGILIGSALLAGSAVGAASYMGDSLQTRQDELARRIAQRRATMLAARNAPADPATAAERELARRKNETASSVIVLEILSQILPDHTYVTELRMEADKLRISGITRDAPGLIRLIEQSRHFTRATFFAPTTRAPSDPGDRFNIETQLVPVFSARP